MATISFMSIPAGSLAKISDDTKRDNYVKQIFTLPQQLREVATSAKVAAYIRGLVKSHALSEDAGPSIAFAILQVLVGERALAQMPIQFSSTLGIANDKAQRIAQEIERDIFAPIALPLNEHFAKVRQQKNSVTGPVTSSQPKSTPNARFSRTPAAPSNILNLKNNPKPPSPPPIPKKDDSTIF